MQLFTHPTRVALQQLLPRAHISGGSFSESLPHPKEIPSDERISLLRNARTEAVDETVDDLLRTIDMDIEGSLPKSSEGNRLWPRGYTGSLTHKGTVVLGALVQKKEAQSIGIDVELDQHDGDNLAHVVCDGEQLPDIDGIDPHLATFSAKESVYKAAYPISRQALGFDDVTISWEETSEPVTRGIADCSESMRVGVQCVSKGKWIVCTASWIE